MTAVDGRLDQQHALITGGGSGIGAAIATELARRGAAVTVSDLELDAAKFVVESIELAGGSAFATECDVRRRESIEAAADAAEAAFGPLSIWVSNAGVSTMRPFTQIPLDEWDQNLAVNTTGVFLCGQVAAERMRRPGVIVNVSSMAGKQGRVKYLAHYVASKFAVVGLTQAMAHELAAEGIRVNAVCPGYVVTPMQEREVIWEAGLRGISTTQMRDMMIADTPLGRLEEPADVARVVAFLCGEDAAFLTGESIAVNGGAFMD